MVGLGPGRSRGLVGLFLGGNGLAPLLALLTSGLEAGVLATHSQELEGFEALARDHRHLLHFAEEADFVGREPGWKREGHGCCLCILWHCLCKFPMSLSLNGSCWLHSKNSGLAWDAPAPR